MVSMHLHELVLIDMGLDWSQIDILAPTLIYVESLLLVRNRCKHICSKFSISKVHFKNLRYLNVEENGIESWDELVGFRALKDLRWLVVNKNKLTDIYYKPGFAGLRQLSIEDNLIRSWRSFDQLNEFDSKIEQLRCAGNPCTRAGREVAVDEPEPDMTGEEADQALRYSKCMVLGKMEFLKKYNGGVIEAADRVDNELYYLRNTLEYYLRFVLQAENDKDR